LRSKALLRQGEMQFQRVKRGRRAHELAVLAVAVAMGSGVAAFRVPLPGTACFRGCRQPLSRTSPAPCAPAVPHSSALRSCGRGRGRGGARALAMELELHVGDRVEVLARAPGCTRAQRALQQACL